MPAFQSFGTAAGEFAKGYLQGRTLQKQQELQEHQRKLEDIQAMAQGLHQFNDQPVLQEKYGQYLNDMLEGLPKGPKTSKGSTQAGAGGLSGNANRGAGGGIREFFGKLFGMGQANKVGPTPPFVPSGSVKLPERPSESIATRRPLPAVTEGSQTFGQAPESFTPPMAERPSQSIATRAPLTGSTALPALNEPPALPMPPQPPQTAPNQGLRVPGTVTNLYDRPVLQNPDGSVSTTSSMSIGTDQGEVLIPTVINGQRLSDEDAIAHYRQTGEHLGIFDTPENADAYASWLHNEQERRGGFGGAPGPAGTVAAAPALAPTLPAPPAIGQPAQSAQSQARQQQLQMPTANDLANLSRSNWWRVPGTGLTAPPQFVGPNQAYMATWAKNQAAQYARSALDIAGQHIEAQRQRDPNALRTSGQAFSDPHFGAEFRQIMNAVQDYEASGLLPKGTLEQWQSGLFEDVRLGNKYDPYKTAEGYQINPVTGRYDIRIGEPKYEDRLHQAYLTVAQNPTPTDPQTAQKLSEAHAMITAHMNELAAKPRESMNPREAMFADLVAEGKANGLSLTEIAKRVVPLVYPQQPPAVFSPVAGGTPKAGSRVATVFNNRSGKFEQTDFILSDRINPDLLMEPIAAPLRVTRPDGTAQLIPKGTKFLKPDRVKAYWESGDIGGIDGLNRLINSNGWLNDADKQDIIQFRQQQLNPFK